MAEPPDSPSGSADGAELLTIDEAADRFNFDPHRLRRRVLAGGVPGAFEQPGSDWRIPLSSLRYLGYLPRTTDPGAEALPTPSTATAEAVHIEAAAALVAAEREWADVAELQEALDEDRAHLREERGRLVAERERLDREWARLDADRAHLDRERQMVLALLEAVQRQLDALAAPRREETRRASIAELSQHRHAPEPGAG